MVRSTTRTAAASAEGGATLSDGQIKTPRLRVNVEKQLASFNLHVQIEVGAEILVLFGPSGAGKTQTLNAIAGLMTPDAGEITLDGTLFFRASREAGSAQRLNLPARKRRVGYVFQQYALFPHLSALENVSYALWRQPRARERAEDLLQRMRLSELATRYPHELSGGQQQRVAIARALAMEPHVLLMDEPFSALDSEIRKQLHQDLLKLQAESELIVIYVTHNLEDAFSVGHRLAVVRDGKIERIGTPADMYPQRTNSILMEVLHLPVESRTR
jgi:molybdate transport system ATP-binding protein